MSKIRVSVYTHPRRFGLSSDDSPEHPRPPMVLAYTLYSGPGACVHEVEAENGTKAKAAAIKEHRAKCLVPAPTPDAPRGEAR